jgi:hypothetical protein
MPEILKARGESKGGTDFEAAEGGCKHKRLSGERQRRRLFLRWHHGTTCHRCQWWHARRGGRGWHARGRPSQRCRHQEVGGRRLTRGGFKPAGHEANGIVPRTANEFPFGAQRGRSAELERGWRGGHVCDDETADTRAYPYCITFFRPWENAPTVPQRHHIFTKRVFV